MVAFCLGFAVTEFSAEACWQIEALPCYTFPETCGDYCEESPSYSRYLDEIVDIYNTIQCKNTLTGYSYCLWMQGDSKPCFSYYRCKRTSTVPCPYGSGYQCQTGDSLEIFYDSEDAAFGANCLET